MTTSPKVNEVLPKESNLYFLLRVHGQTEHDINDRCDHGNPGSLSGDSANENLTRECADFHKFVRLLSS